MTHGFQKKIYVVCNLFFVWFPQFLCSAYDLKIDTYTDIEKLHIIQSLNIILGNIKTRKVEIYGNCHTS